eukprot:TRINITY_DN52127_c0_g1_i1.p1 TRINITY_DN52127_c0_g1~~TRINITY_DN52127_c0_g1_i1.p1  ORF type:complete len:112 (+),score=42.00 TRINITY_DN52127_c0_g1_i1:138-473(+)
MVSYLHLELCDPGLLPPKLLLCLLPGRPPHGALLLALCLRCLELSLQGTGALCELLLCAAQCLHVLLLLHRRCLQCKHLCYVFQSLLLQCGEHAVLHAVCALQLTQPCTPL